MVIFYFHSFFCLSFQYSDTAILVKSQSAFAMYDGYEWNGTLVALVPGQGYMLRNTAGKARSFNYPVAAAAAPRMSPARKATSAFTTIDHHLYSGNMTIVALVAMDNTPLANSEVAVYVGNECRAAAFTDDEGYAYITVPGEDAVELTFKTYWNDILTTCEETCKYVNNDVLGTHAAPYVINFAEANATGIDGMAGEKDSHDIYDMSGRKMSNNKLRKGVYIIDGKKAVVH